ncbi:MAG: ATP-binding protein [Akkermansiaceae bacterium]|nr:ATP-binding protein [Akkermansiaceae bacterium]MDP4720221.1 ATP-binding protein [Akkermansiaceae bacterium]MDP4780499.1 ATP-binding protein [Akkermansiaceae bacterium]MDP4897948.1 ATP-binding protein [Akkermansiaceae bacterium]
MPRYFRKIAFLLTAACCMVPTLLHSEEATGLGSHKLSELEAQLDEIDRTLLDQAELTLRTGVGNLGWLSKLTPEPREIEWAQVEFTEPKLIDQIILVPVIVRDSHNGNQSDGFPQEFKILAGNADDSEGITIAEYSAADHLTPRVAPLVISFDPVEASWVRIEAKPIPSKTWGDRSAVQLSELLVFSGEENVALRCPVKVSSSERDWVRYSTFPAALVDGLMPYLMDAAEGEKGEPFIVFYGSGRTYKLSVDLGKSIPLSGIYLHSADIRENIPRIYHADYAMPRHMKVEGASQADFSDARTLVDFQRETIYQAGPMVMLPFPETDCRYVRLSVLEGYQAPEATGSHRCTGFAEIELLSKGTNVALGKIFESELNIRNTQGELPNLTDGLDHYGEILPIRTWLNQLALRHDLEYERPLIVAELGKRYSIQKAQLRIMYWIAAILGAGIVLIILIDRILRLRQVARLKQRFAADLHDELGANLHSIGLISDVAQDAETKDEWQTLSARIRELTERTGTAVRHCTNMLESKNLYFGLVGDMRRAAERITTNATHDINIEGEEHLQKLKARLRVDLFLFYRECLINICRHSGATHIETHLVAEKQRIVLTVTDNGTGLPADFGEKLPLALERRAKLLRGKLTITSPPSGGTSVHLKIRPKSSSMLRFLYPF